MALVLKLNSSSKKFKYVIQSADQSSEHFKRFVNLYNAFLKHDYSLTSLVRLPYKVAYQYLRQLNQLPRDSYGYNKLKRIFKQKIIDLNLDESLVFEEYINNNNNSQ